MRWQVVLCAGLLGLAGCAQTTQDRARELTRDGLLLYQNGAYGEARDQFQAALTLRPEDADLIFHLASCQEKLGKKGDAQELYQRVLHHDPNHLGARHALVLHQLENSQRDEAFRTVQEWLRTNPGNPGPYIEDGWLRALQGDLDSARGRFQQALAIDPRHPRALDELGRIYEKLDRPDRAIVLYERSLASNPDQPQVKRHLEELRARGVSRPRPD